MNRITGYDLLTGRGARAALIGVGAPLACAAHCLAAPLLAAASPALAHGPAEAALRLVTVAVAAFVLASGVRAHGRRLVLAPAAAGVAAWLLADAAPAAETPLSVAGGVLIAAATLWSSRLRHRAVCASCGCPAHPHG